LFELGARWGASRHLVPLVASGISPSDLRPPLSNLNTLSCTTQTDLHQLLGDIARVLGAPQPNASVYARQLEQLMSLSDASSRLRNRAGGAHENASLGVGPQTQIQSPVSPVTQTGKELLSLIQAPEIADEKRGITEIFDSIEPGMTYFLPSLMASGSTFSMKSRLFKEGVQELLSKGWLYPPEEDGRVRTYEYKKPA
jgi:hypothetical protein